MASSHEWDFEGNEAFLSEVFEKHLRLQLILQYSKLNKHVFLYFDKFLLNNGATYLNLTLDQKSCSYYQLDPEDTV